MSTLGTIGIGTVANDETGTDFRTAGQIINDNFAALNADKLEYQSTKETFTATAAQTVFTLTEEPNNVDVYIDRMYQLEGIDYTLSTNQVTLTEGAYLNSIITIRKH
jgi:hypothetical protein